MLSTRIKNRWTEFNLTGIRHQTSLIHVSFAETVSVQNCSFLADRVNTNINENGWPWFLTATYKDLINKLSGDKFETRHPDNVCTSAELTGPWGYLTQRPGALGIRSGGMYLHFRSSSDFFCMHTVVPVVLRAFLLDVRHFVVDLNKYLNNTSTDK